MLQKLTINNGQWAIGKELIWNSLILTLNTYSVLVTPETLNRITGLELRARQIVEGFITGLHKSPYYGFSVEFAEHRPYNTGDEIRHIDWKAYGKSERYYVKQYEEETNLRSYILLDVSSSMNFRYYAEWTKLTYAVHLAAAMSILMQRQRDACGLITFDRQMKDFIPSRSSVPHIKMIMDYLERYADIRQVPDEHAVTASASVIHELAERLRKRSFIIIISDLFENVNGHDELLSALKHLRYGRHEVVLFNILEHRSERELDLPDHLFSFRDLETGLAVEALPSQIRHDYRLKINNYIRSFKKACSEVRIDFEEIDTAGAFDHALLAWLKKRKRIG